MVLLLKSSDSYLAGSVGFYPCSAGLIESDIGRKIDGQASHGAGGKWLDLGDCPQDGGLVAVCAEGEFGVDRAGVVDHSNPGGIWADAQGFDDLGHKHFHLFKFRRADTPRAVDDEDKIGGFSSAKTCMKGKERKEDVKEGRNVGDNKLRDRSKKTPSFQLIESANFAAFVKSSASQPVVLCIFVSN